MSELSNQGGLKILANSGWLFVDKILRQGLNFLLTAFIARYLGVAEFGEWNYAIAFVALFSFFSTLGLYNLLQRDFVRFPERREELLGSALFLKFLGGCLTLFFSFTTIVIVKPDVSFIQILVFVTALGYVAQSMDVVDFYYQSQLQARKIATARTISFCFIALFKLAFIYLKLPLLFFAIAQSTEFLLSGFLLTLFLNAEVKFHSLTVRWGTVKNLFTASLPILFSEIAIIIYMRTDQVMISEMIGNEALGNYSAAVKLSEIWYFIPIVISSSLFPSIIKAHSEDLDGYSKRLQQMYDFLSFISIAIAISVSILSPFIVNIIFGPSFSGATIILTIHIWTGLFVFWGVASGNQLVVEGLTRVSLYRSVSGMIINVILNFILIPLYGTVGSAIATLAAQAFATYLFDIFNPLTKHMFYMKSKSLLFLNVFSFIKDKVRKDR